MPSKISYFNKGLFFNNIKRFWLITFSYTLLLSLYIMSYLNSVSEQKSTYIREGINKMGSDIFHSGEIMLLLLGFFPLVAGLAVFSYMHFQRNTAMIHSLPMRRETLFVTNYLSGFFIVVFPLLFNGIILLVGEALIGIFSSLSAALLWLGVNLVLSFLLYTFTVFVGMFTGHLAAQAIFFLIFNFLATFLESMIKLVQSRFLFGFSDTSYSLEVLSPLYYMSTLFSGFAQEEGNFGVLVGYLVAGLFFLISSYFLYRKRHVEVATDVISFPIVKPIFKYSVAFCSSALLGSLLVSSLNIRGHVLGYILTYLIGGMIGYFASEMLLRKTFRVFKAYKGFLVFALVLVLLLSSISFDFFGYESRVPQDNEVEVMYLSQYPSTLIRLALTPENYRTREHGYWFSSPDTLNPPSKLSEEHIKELRGQAGINEDREAITKARQIHAYIVENKEMFKASRSAIYDRALQPVDEKYYNLYFIYRLNNGRLVERHYSLYLQNDSSQLEQLLREYMALPQVREKFAPILQKSAKDFRAIYVTQMDGTRKSIPDIEGFLNVYKQDILAQDQDFNTWRDDPKVSQYLGFNIYPELIEPSNYININIDRYNSLPVSPSYKNTLDYLLDYGLITQDQINGLSVE